MNNLVTNIGPFRVLRKDPETMNTLTHLLKDYTCVIKPTFLLNSDESSNIKEYLSTAKQFYPEFDSWFINKALDYDIERPRIFIVIRNKDKIVATAILRIGYEKKSSSKICCFKYDMCEPEIVKHCLLRHCHEVIYSMTTHIRVADVVSYLTVPCEMFKILAPFFQQYGYNTRAIVVDLYRKGKNEFIFNAWRGMRTFLYDNFNQEEYDQQLDRVFNGE